MSGSVVILFMGLSWVYYEMGKIHLFSSSSISPIFTLPLLVLAEHQVLGLQETTWVDLAIAVKECTD